VTALPDSISVSQITLYLTCPLKYQFQYVDRLPRLTKSSNMAFGAAMHAALEWLHKSLKRGRRPALEEIHRVFEADFRAQENISYANGDDPDQLLLKGKELLSLYYHEGELRVRDAEIGFTLPLVHPRTGEKIPVPLKGVIDLVEEDGTISEFKNAKKAFDLETLPDNLQLTAYHYAYEMLFRDRPKDLKLVQFVRTKQPKIETHVTGRDQRDVERFFGIAKQVRRAIEAGIFVPNRGCWMCFDCEYEADCLDWTGSEG
jgi:putative RecB family exonuclease